MGLIITTIENAKDKMSVEGWIAYCKDSVELDNFNPNTCDSREEIALDESLAKYKYHYT